MANAPAVGATTAAQRYGGDNSAKAKIWGAYLVQNIDKWGAEVYLAWQTHKLSIRSGMTTDVNNASYAYISLAIKSYSDMGLVNIKKRDGRSLKIFLTPKGRELARGLKKIKEILLEGEEK